MKFTCPECGSDSFTVYKDADDITISGEFVGMPDLSMGALGIICAVCGAEWGWWKYEWEIEYFIKAGDYSKMRL